MAAMPVMPVMTIRMLLLVLVALVAAAAIQLPPRAPRSSYKVVHVYPHDRSAFTQGLEYADGFVYEGTGLNGQSSIRKVKLETGEVVQQHDVPAEHFGEGITIWKSDLIELTWRSQIALVYDLATLSQKRTFSYLGEGWGLTHDDTSLIMSDGSAALRFLDPATFAERRRLMVTDGGLPVPHLNELEVVRGEVYANIWQTNFIARIDPGSGVVIGWIDLTGLLSAADSRGVDVMNGIAYDAAHDRLFVTGKLWPKLFEIKVK
jgi:glutaminyl-peptide cyclotransferase